MKRELPEALRNLQKGNIAPVDLAQAAIGPGMAVFSRYGKVIRFLNDVLLSAPSILVGLFVYEILVAPLKGFSGLAGSVALGLIAAPVITRTTEDVLRRVFERFCVGK